MSDLVLMVTVIVCLSLGVRGLGGRCDEYWDDLVGLSGASGAWGEYCNGLSLLSFLSCVVCSVDCEAFGSRVAPNYYSGASDET